MASAELREELDCSVCLHIYTDPVMLSCGHNFCRVCMGNVLDTQEGSGVYTCPECRAEFQERPALHRNLTLCNIAERFRANETKLEDSGIFCTYCVYTPAPAAKTCLHCEASLCEVHLKAHTTSTQHVLTEPTKSIEDRKCSLHQRLIEYYCSEDAACVCVSCCLAGEHKGHQLELLSEAAEKKKEKLREVLEQLTSKSEETEKKIQSLQDRRKEGQAKACGVSERVGSLFRDIRNQLEFLERRVLLEISWQSVQVSLKVSDLLLRMETKKEDLGKKMSSVERLYDTPDPITLLQGREPADSEGEEDGGDETMSDVGDLDEVRISVTLQTALADILKGSAVKMASSDGSFSDACADEDTAGNCAPLAADLKAPIIVLDEPGLGNNCQALRTSDVITACDQRQQIL
ncbi:E3 ubiquitin/ISG15 ligase TRIM25-like [Pelodytes ibericus]